MPIEFHCYACGQRLRVADEHQSQRARCPRCHTVLDIPSMETTVTPVILGKNGPVADIIDYEVFGHEMQYVEITLDPGEVAMAEAGALMYMTPGIEMETVGGDPASKPSGILAKLLSTGQRMLTGEALSMTAFFNAAQGREVVALAARYPGKLVPLQLSELGGELICPRNALLCVARGVGISVAYQQRSPAGLFSPDGFLMQRVSGDGIAVLTAAGTLLHRKLDAEETLHVDARRLVALLPSVRYDVHSVSEINTASATGEPFLLATLTGPGEIWLQSLPFTHVMVGRPDAE